MVVQNVDFVGLSCQQNRVAHPKPKSDRKEEKILIKLTSRQKQTLERAADLEGGLAVSTWLRQLGLKAAQEILGKGDLVTSEEV